MDTSEIRRRVDAFDRWHYQFDLNGVLTPIHDQTKVNRHVQRERYAFGALLAATGGSLAGLRVLDLGCNAGWWSLKAIEAGAEFVLGVDGRDMHIEQAQLVFDVKGIPPARYAFSGGNAFDFDFGDEPFDVVLCLGLLYHVVRPFELLEIITAVNRDLVLLDTVLSRQPGSNFTLHTEDLADARNAVDHSMVLHPSREAIRDLAAYFGYEAVVVRPDAITNYGGMRGYERGYRRAFVWSKHSRLEAIPADSWETPLPSVRATAQRRTPPSLLDRVRRQRRSP